MPAVPKAHMKYVVSFNGRFGGEDYGDADMNTADFEHNDIDELVAEVIADDLTNPKRFIWNTDVNSAIIGYFWSIEEESEDEYPDDSEDEYPVAVMVDRATYF